MVPIMLLKATHSYLAVSQVRRIRKTGRAGTFDWYLTLYRRCLGWGRFKFTPRRHQGSKYRSGQRLANMKPFPIATGSQ